MFFMQRIIKKYDIARKLKLKTVENVVAISLDIIGQ
jgi:hypothetical protein